VRGEQTGRRGRQKTDAEPQYFEGDARKPSHLDPGLQLGANRYSPSLSQRSDNGKWQAVLPLPPTATCHKSRIRGPCTRENDTFETR
jgi:hypothetical protein